MVVSMLQLLIELPESTSLKDKRRIVVSLKDKLQRRFKLSAAEIDLLDSPSYAHIGAALVSNSRDFGEKVLNKAFAMVENDIPIRIHDVRIYSEEF